MAERPVFIPAKDEGLLVREIYFDLQWNAGFAQVQKRKNIVALHEAAAKSGYSPVLEVSSKSETELGRQLSAFQLQVRDDSGGEMRLEAAFQGSKVFERGGPFTDLYSTEGREAKRDPRLQESGKLTGFRFDGFSFPLEPKTIFYDWLYVTAIYPNRAQLERLSSYAGFSDIEFNPAKSINCQARSCALFVSLTRNGQLQRAVASAEAFLQVISEFDYRPQLKVSGLVARG
jgi:hypothetical protein